jgi:Holliday junction resolvasome RuvABC endonuclease subunit
MNVRTHYGFVVAIYPNSRGLAFVVFEGATSVLDWGVLGARYKHSRGRYLTAIAALLERYQPSILVLQDMSSAGTHRAQRIQNLNEAIMKFAEDRDIPVRSYSRERVREAFALPEPATKAAIAEAIAKYVPAFERHVPPARKPWTSEHARMGLFDAAALALTFFWRNSER